MSEILVLRAVHVLGGIFWVGSGLFMSVFVVPSLAKAPYAPQVFAGLQQRRLFTVLPIVGLLTILSGARLMMIMSNNFAAAYFQSNAGRTYAWAGAAAIAAFLVSLLVARPAGIRAAALGAKLSAAPDENTRAQIAEELARLRRIGGITSVIATVLVVLAALGMSIARYV